MRSIAASNRSGSIPLPSINSRLKVDCPDSEIKLINESIAGGANLRCVGEVIGILGESIRRSASDSEID